MTSECETIIIVIDGLMKQFEKKLEEWDCHNNNKGYSEFHFKNVICTTGVYFDTSCTQSVLWLCNGSCAS